MTVDAFAVATGLSVTVQVQMGLCFARQWLNSNTKMTNIQLMGLLS